jgi:hypothetical protein
MDLSRFFIARNGSNDTNFGSLFPSRTKKWLYKTVKMIQEVFVGFQRWKAGSKLFLRLETVITGIMITA